MDGQTDGHIAEHTKRDTKRRMDGRTVAVDSSAGEKASSESDGGGEQRQRLRPSPSMTSLAYAHWTLLLDTAAMFGQCGHNRATMVIPLRFTTGST